MLFTQNLSGEDTPSSPSVPPTLESAPAVPIPESTLPTPTPTPETAIQTPEPQTPEPQTPEPQIPEPPQALNANYSQLEALLQERRWREADAETYKVMLEVSRQQGLVKQRQGLEWLDEESINNFSCPDLTKIDQLWRTYSNNHFGFNIQKRIWLELGGQTDQETRDILFQRLGWQKTISPISDRLMLLYHTGITFDIRSPEGHLPTPPNLQIMADISSARHIPFLVFALAQRAVNCEI